MPRHRQSATALGTATQTRIAKSRVLMVGAGGIGCELLKNLVLTGFGEIHIVDLDTIDLSNLNRQFLFGHEHIKRSKALVAKEMAGKFNPRVKIEAHHANIKDPGFNITWFQTFNLVFNALDNLEARRHVNKMCLAADVPLIESGTTGFNGQVQVIKRGISECYDCNPKETPKTFPVCTIRSTPSQPIHCIVWAKSYLFSEIFGTSEHDAPEMDTTEDSENAQEIETLRAEAQALKRIRDSMGSEDFPRKVFEKVFVEDIERLRGMEDMWKSRRKPKALDFDDLAKHALGVGSAIATQDQKAWTAAENFAVFTSSLQELSARLETLRASTASTDAAPPILTFDKDDKATLSFVAAAANLRSLIFDIAPKSEFDIKQMAGNIIPAIATTNAMTASLCVLQSFKILRGDYNKARMMFLSKSADRLVSSEPLRPPKEQCPVCGVCQARIVIDLERATLKDLVEEILRGQLAYGEEISIATEAGIVFDPEEDENLPKKLADLGVKPDTFITVTDENDDKPRINLVLAVVAPNPDFAATDAAKDAPPMSLPDKFEIARKAAPPSVMTNGQANGYSNGVTANDGPVMSNGSGGTIGKRKRDADEADIEAELVSKKGKVFEETPGKLNKGVGGGNDQGDDDLVLVEDGGGAIVIDD